MKSDFEETPFDSQMQDDLHSRRAQPTHDAIRIGPNATQTTPIATADSAANAAPISMPDSAAPAAQRHHVPNAPKERMPLPVVIGLAMAVGAVCVVGASIGMKRAIKPVDPIYPTVTALPPSGDEVMLPPETVLKEPENKPDVAAAPDSAPPPVSAPQAENAAPENTTSVEMSTLPNGNTAKTPATSGTYPPSATHQGAGFEITPPPGFTLRQSGRRTIWQRADGAQILVETGKAGDGSPRAGWQKLDRDLARRYGERYRSLGIREGTLAGQPAAIWEFELTGKDGITRRKTDIGIKVNGRGYAVLGSAPKAQFGAVSGDLQQALNSFRVKTTGQPQEQPDKTNSEAENTEPRASQTQDSQQPRVRLTPVPKSPEPKSPEPTSPVPQPEGTRETEKGY